MPDTSADEDQPWTTLKASAVNWLLPATAARHTAHLPLRRAFASHIAAALLTVLLFFLLAAWAETRGPTEHIWSEFTELIDDVVREARRDPEEFFAILAASIAGIEVGYVILALLLMSWGARDEPVRSSFANALRQTWLLTSHVVVTVFLVGLLIVPLIRAYQQWIRTGYQRVPQLTYAPPPRPPPNAQPGTPAWKEYQAARQRHRQEQRQARLQQQKIWEERWRQRPWYVKYDEEVIGYACFAAATWILWVLLRAIGADRSVPPILRPPTCESCGYNLTATPVESRCPECGEPAVASLGPNVRPGTLWQRRREVGWPHAWWRCGADVIARPRWFSRQLKTVSPGSDHRLFLAGHLVPIFFIGAVGIITCYVVDTGWNPLERAPEVVWLGGPLAGYLTSVSMLVFALLTAGAVGIGYRIVQKRNLIGPAMQSASYLAGYLTLWALFAAVMGIATFALEEWFDDLRKTLPIDDEILAFFFWLLPNLACLGLYFMLVWRATAGARYANR